MESSAFAPARSSSAICRSASTRLGFTIQYDALIERVSKNAAGVQMSRTPCVDRAWNDITTQPVAGYRPVDPVVIEQSLAHDKEIIVAIWSICAACAATEKNDGAGMQSFDETVYRFREPGIFFIDRCCIESIYRPRGRNPTKT
jgi:hypothetical protein